MIRNKISSDVKDLNELNKQYSWLPNEIMVRPSSDERIKKEILIYQINKEWLSTKDYILHSIFGKNYQNMNGIKFVSEQANLLEWVFQPCIFRYNLEENSNHYILWNSKFKFNENIDDNLINEILKIEINKIIGHNNFDFAWYKNPKPSVMEFFHLQVFWKNII
jgi:hypothetical protein